MLLPMSRRLFLSLFPLFARALVAANVFTSLAPASTAFAAATMSPHDIMAKNDDVRKIAHAVSHAKMTTGGGGSTERVKEFTWWRKLKPDNVHFNTLTRFLFPPEVKNEGILFVENPDATDIQIYLPTFKKVRRVETGQQSGSFMGSEFSYSDIAAPHVDDFTYKTLKEETCPGTSAKNVKCWLIESTPAKESVKDRTGISTAQTWIRQDNFMAAQAEYKDIDGQPWKRLDIFKTEEVDKKNHKWMSTSLKMTNLKNQKFTSLEFDSVKTDEAIPDNIFTVQNLSR